MKDSVEKKGFAFEIFLLLLAVPIIGLGIYESLTQRYVPGLSLLASLHSINILKGYSVEYGPSDGIWHIMGWVGSMMMVLMMLYSVRKRFKPLRRCGSLRHWLSAHMFLGIMGPILVTFHTTFKLHGIIATSFYCMTVTMVFGILGRYIYVQIPRSISGVELEANDIEKIVKDIESKLEGFMQGAAPGRSLAGLSSGISFGAVDAVGRHPLKVLLSMMKTDIINRFKVFRLRGDLRRNYNISGKAGREIVYYLKKRAALIRRRNFLSTSHSLLHYWHVLHVPLAIVMFIIMFLHVLVYYLFRPGL